MKKIFTFALLLAALFYAQFAAAQQTLYVYSKSGNLSAYSVNKVTFDNDFFTFTYGDVTEITKEMFTASFAVALKSDDYKYFEQALEVGICFSDVNETPTVYDGKIKKGSYLSDYTYSIYGLDAGTTYYYRAYVKINDAVCYGDVNSITTFGKKPSYKIINGHKFVDLGLPSGLLWATCNVGATTSADNGSYFTWGETDMAINSIADNDSCKYYSGLCRYTKYNYTDKKTVLAIDDDAAYINWGDSCRMPSIDELIELYNSSNCVLKWVSMTTSDGSSIHGYKVTSVKNGNSIFLPASGYRKCGYPSYLGSNGYYWSSTLGGFSYRAYCLSLDSNCYQPLDKDRYYSCTIRPVAKP